jgi:hypothetical protein
VIEHQRRRQTPAEPIADYCAQSSAASRIVESNDVSKSGGD